MEQSMSRDEYRARLREKIATSRNQRCGTGSSGTPTARAVRKDPTTALLSLGVDDPNVLHNARDICNADAAAIKSVVKKMAKQERRKKAVVKPTEASAESDEEEAPPPLAHA